MSFAATSAKNAATPVAPRADAANIRAEMNGRAPQQSAGSNAHSFASLLPGGGGQAVSPAPAFCVVTQRVRLVSAPAWFDALAEQWRIAKQAAWQAVQSRSRDDKTSIATVAYRAMPATMPSNVRSQLAIETMAEWRSHKALWKQGRGRSVPRTMHAGPRFAIHPSGIQLIAEAQMLTVRARRKSGEWAELVYECGESQQAKLLAATKVLETEFQKRDGNWYALIPVRLPVAEHRGMGLCAVRSLQKNLLTAAMVYPGGGCISRFISGREYWKKREYYRRERAIAQQKRKWRMRRHLRGAEGRWSSNYTHELAADFVGWLREHRCGVLILGRHTHLRKKEQGPKWKAKRASNWRSAHWSFRMLLDRVAYKARLAGIVVCEVDEAKLWVRSACWRCGEDVDEEANVAECRCGMRAGREWNALRNLLAASGWQGKMQRISEDAARAKPTDAFDGSAFGVPDLMQRLEYAGK